MVQSLDPRGERILVPGGSRQRRNSAMRPGCQVTSHGVDAAVDELERKARVSILTWTLVAGIGLIEITRAGASGVG